MVRAVLAVLLLLTLSLQTQAAFAQQVDWVPPDEPKLERIASTLVQRLRAARAKPVAAAEGTAAERVMVLLEPGPGLLADSIDRTGLERAGAQVVDQSPHLLQASVAPGDLEAVARVAGVGFVQVPEPPVMCNVVSEGVARIGAAAAQAQGVRGRGAKVAVIDYGFAGAPALAGTELPAIGWYIDHTGTGIGAGSEVHGTACAEIVHDVAPEAELYLHKVLNLLQFENAVDRCIADGIHVINFSGGWIGTGFGDGEGLACDVVDKAADNGILWVNAAGNLAERQYTGLSTDADADRWHEFAPGVERIYLDEAQVGTLIRLALTWDEWPATYEDWDLYLGREAPDGSVVTDLVTSVSAQTNTAPAEFVTHLIAANGRYFAAIRSSHTTRPTTLKLSSFYHPLASYADVFGTIGEPADARGAFAVGAVAELAWPLARIESYSSRGPTLDGRVKPEIVAPTWVSTSSFGAGAFAGTSPAAPHVAGVAALVKSANPAYTATQLANALAVAAADAGDAGKDNTFGYGLLAVPAPYSVSGLVTLAGQPVHSGVTIVFSRLTGAGAIPAAVQTSATGTWSASGFEPGSVYAATPSNPGWAFVPGSSQFTAATTTLNFTGQQTSYAASGRVTLAGQSDHAGVTITFARLFGTGAVPPAVQTSATGAWSASGFGFGSVYLATPSRPGWAFVPGSAQFSSGSTALDFTGQQTSYAASGRVTLAGQSGHGGVTVTFARLFGTGAVPPAVQTTPSGTWSANGFEPGSVYLATPNLSGWSFAPTSAQFSQALTNLDFVGQAPPYAVAGKAQLAGQSDHSGTSVVFTRVSGTGAVPNAVQTTVAGAWSANGFELGTVYQATPIHPGWLFAPPAAQFSGSTTSLDFTAQPPPFGVFGTTTLAGQSDHSGTVIAFTRVSGTGAVPDPVHTDLAGAWSANGFQTGTVYRATPERPAWAFAPAWRDFAAATTTLDFAGSMPPIGLLVRAVVGSSRSASPARVVVGRRVVVEVLKYALPGGRDSTAVAAFSLQVPAALGVAAGANAVRLSTVAGVTGALVVSAEGLTEQLQITTLPGTIDHLAIEPEAALVTPGEQVDFSAQGADSYGNRFALAGANVAWHCVPAALGSIAASGLFTAGAGGEGYIIAVVSQGLRFGDAEVSSGTGRIVIRGARPAAFDLHQNTPNPFNPETTVRFDLAQARQVRLEVFDGTGRRVRRLVDEALPAGSHAVRWDGTGDDGAALGSGVFFVRLAAGDFVSVRKALLVR